MAKNYAAAHQWNARYPQGTRVRIRWRDGACSEDRTAGLAQQWGDLGLLALQQRPGLFTTQALLPLEEEEPQAP